MPTCHKCNSEYGALENELLTQLALCVDPKAAASSGIADRVLRGLDPAYAKNDKDALARRRKRERFVSGLLIGNDIPTEGIYPGLGERWGRPKGSGIAFIIPERSLRLLTEKIVRGIAYVDDRKFIEPTHTIEFYAIHDKDANPVKELLAQYGKEYARGAGIKIVRALLPDDGVTAVMSIEIWEAIVMFASVMPKVDTVEAGEL